MVWSSVIGLVTALAFAASGGLELRGYRFDIVCLGFFGLIFALLVLLPRVISWQQRPWEGLWRALAPFEAQYDIHDIDGGGKQVIYTRITKAATTARWTRTLASPAIFGNGYSLFFAPAPSMQCVLLHAADTRFEEMFAQCPPPR